MYQIISLTNGEILSETDSPIYSKINPDSGVWIPATEFDAECVVVNGKRCLIYGKPFAAGTEKVVFIKKVDGAEKISKRAQDSLKISADTLDVMEAIIELDRKQNILFNVVAALNKSLEELKNANS